MGAFRDELDAAQQRAEALEREAAELRANDAQDQARIQSLEAELKQARAAVQAARKEVRHEVQAAPGDTPKKTWVWVAVAALVAASVLGYLALTALAAP